MTRVGLVGPGRVGRSVAGLLPSRQFQLGPVISRTLHSAKRAVRDLGKGSACNDWASLRECDLVLVCVPDAVGPAVLDVIGRHCSAVTPPRILYTGRTLKVTQKILVRSARFYPLRVFQRQALDLSGVSFAISGDRAGLAAARKVARALGGQTLVLSPDRLEQAVIGASLASDALTGLLELAVQRIVAAGVPAVVPWMQYTDSWTPASTTSSGPALGLDRDHCWKVDQRLCKAYWTFAVVMIPSQVSFTAPLCN